MELEEMKQLWSDSNRKLEGSMRLNTELLHQANLGNAGSSLKQLSRGIGIGVVVNLIGLVLVGSFAADHFREPRFLIPAVALGLYAIAILIAGVRQLVDIETLDYDEPVVAIQRKLETLRLRRIRVTQWTLLFAPLMWVPLLVVGLRGLFGVGVYSTTDSTWLVANALFGFAVIPLAIFLSRKYGHRMERFTLIRTLADEIAGRSLTAALDSLDTIRRFEEEPA